MITITGATGKTGSAVAEILLEKGEHIRAIGRSKDRLEKLRMKGAEIAIGDQGDVDFMTKALTGSDALYLLIPPKLDAEDFRIYYNNLGNAAVTALQRSSIKKVVFLSSLGADKPAGTGPIVGLHDVEDKLRRLENIDTVFLRSGYFMENTLGNMELISTKSINGGSIPADIPVLMTATADIAAKAAELLMNRSFAGHSIVEIVGDRISFAGITAILGSSLGIPALPYIQFTDSDTEAAFAAIGFSPSIAHAFVEMAHGIADGLISTTLTDQYKPSAPTKFAQFAEEVFKPAFMSLVHHTTA